MRKHLTQKIVRELLNYDPLTGILTWKRRDRKWFADDWHWKLWNTRYAERPAFTATHYLGYKVGAIFGKNYRAHRIIWLWMTGHWPDEVDHREHARDDNRWSVLFNTDHIGNACNQTLRCTNTSGHVGISKHGNGYRIQIGPKNHRYSRTFPTYEEAVVAWEVAARKHDYHPNHGKPKP